MVDFQAILEENRSLRAEVRELKRYIDLQRKRNQISDVTVFLRKGNEYVKKDGKLLLYKAEVLTSDYTDEGRKIGITIPCQ